MFGDELIILVVIIRHVIDVRYKCYKILRVIQKLRIAVCEIIHRSDIAFTTFKLILIQGSEGYACCFGEFFSGIESAQPCPVVIGTGINLFRCMPFKRMICIDIRYTVQSVLDCGVSLH